MALEEKPLIRMIRAAWLSIPTFMPIYRIVFEIFQFGPKWGIEQTDTAIPRAMQIKCMITFILCYISMSGNVPLSG